MIHYFLILIAQIIMCFVCNSEKGKKKELVEDIHPEGKKDSDDEGYKEGEEPPPGTPAYSAWVRQNRAEGVELADRTNWTNSARLWSSQDNIWDKEIAWHSNNNPVSELFNDALGLLF